MDSHDHVSKSAFRFSANLLMVIIYPGVCVADDSLHYPSLSLSEMIVV
jgi:hypothetical protein